MPATSQLPSDAFSEIPVGFFFTDYLSKGTFFEAIEKDARLGGSIYGGYFVRQIEVSHPKNGFRQADFNLVNQGPGGYYYPARRRFATFSAEFHWWKYEGEDVALYGEIEGTCSLTVDVLNNQMTANDIGFTTNTGSKTPATLFSELAEFYALPQLADEYNTTGQASNPTGGPTALTIPASVWDQYEFTWDITEDVAYIKAYRNTYPDTPGGFEEQFEFTVTLTNELTESDWRDDAFEIISLIQTLDEIADDTRLLAYYTDKQSSPSWNSVNPFTTVYASFTDTIPTNTHDITLSLDEFFTSDSTGVQQHIATAGTKPIIQRGFCVGDGGTPDTYNDNGANELLLFMWGRIITSAQDPAGYVCRTYQQLDPTPSGPTQASQTLEQFADGRWGYELNFGAVGDLPTAGLYHYLATDGAC